MSPTSCTGSPLASLSSIGMEPAGSSGQPLDAGPFAAWLAEMGRALRTQGATTVPCDGCVACCSSSQFVHIEPDERDALDAIPAHWLFPAPGMPQGFVVMG